MDLERPAVRNGVIAGLGTSCLALVLYLISALSFFAFAGILTTILVIIFMVRAVREERVDLDYLSFNGALNSAFVVYLIATLLYSIFYFVLFNFIDPTLIDIQKEILAEIFVGLGRFFGEDFVEQTMDALDARDQSYGLGTAIWLFVQQLIPGFIIAAIIAAVMKDRKPVS